MYPWFTWYLHPLIVPISAILIFFVYFRYNREWFAFTKTNASLSLILFFLASWMSLLSNFNNFIGNMLIFGCIFFVINLQQNIKIAFIEYTTNGMAIILGISLFFYILLLLGVPLKYTNIEYKNGWYPSHNYYTFITGIDLIGMYRFKSIFMEPGHLTMGLAPLLFVNKYNIKNKSVLILLIAQLFTLSLAGYITMAIGILFQSLSKSQGKTQRKMLLVIITIIVILGTSITKDDFLYKSVISRFEIVDGKLAGDNRFSSYLESYYDRFVRSSDFLTGIGQDYFKHDFGANSGYKLFLIQHGLIGGILVVIFYTFLSFKFLRHETFGLSLTILMLLLQNSYPLWFAVPFVYICGMPFMAENSGQKALNAIV